MGWTPCRWTMGMDVPKFGYHAAILNQTGWDVQEVAVVGNFVQQVHHVERYPLQHGSLAPKQDCGQPYDWQTAMAGGCRYDGCRRAGPHRIAIGDGTTRQFRFITAGSRTRCRQRREFHSARTSRHRANHRPSPTSLPMPSTKANGTVCRRKDGGTRWCKIVWPK